MNIGLATSGLWRLRDAVELLTDGEACKLAYCGFQLDAIAGWGHKPTAAKARRKARQLNKPYVAFEDGFLRSILPGDSEMPLGIVMDRTGIYYDASRPSDLEMCINRRQSIGSEISVTRALEHLCASRLSKYNYALIDNLGAIDLLSSDRKERVLVVDQTAGDTSIIGAGATAETFDAMLAAAVSENPGSEILLRVHPETMLGQKLGHFSLDRLESLAKKNSALERCHLEGRLRFMSEPVNPWVLLEACAKVYCVSSQLGFEGVLAGCEVHCFGMPFYGGWGITCDRSATQMSRRKRATVEAVFAGAYIDYSFYIDHKSKSLMNIHEAIDALSQRRKSFQAEQKIISDD